MLSELFYLYNIGYVATINDTNAQNSLFWPCDERLL